MMPESENPSQNLIATVLEVHQAAGDRPADCPMIEWVRGQGALSPQDLREQLVARTDWRALQFKDAFRAVATYAHPEKLEAELFYAGKLKERPDRILLEQLLAGEAATMEPATVQLLIEALCLIHPNPKGFCVDPAVAVNIPSSIDLTSVPALSYVKAHDQDGVLVALADLVVSGGRDPEPLSAEAEEMQQLRREIAQLKAARPPMPSLLDIANLMRAARADPVEP